MKNTLEELMILFLLSMKCKLKVLKMRESLSIYVLKSIKWNVDIMELLKVFHIQKLIHFLKYVVYVLLPKSHILFPTYA